MLAVYGIRGNLEAAARLSLLAAMKGASSANIIRSPCPGISLPFFVACRARGTRPKRAVWRAMQCGAAKTTGKDGARRDATCQAGERKPRGNQGCEKASGGKSRKGNAR